MNACLDVEDGPLFIGIDTHALSEPAFASALEVLAANGVEVMIDAGNGYTPTPVISHADPRLQPRPHARASPTASSSRRRTTRRGSAASNTIHPPGGPADTRRDSVDRTAGQRLHCRRPARRGRACRSSEARSAATTHPHHVPRHLRERSSRRWSTWRPSAAARCISAWIRWAAPAWPTGTPIGERYGLNLDGRQSRRSIPRSDS